MSRQEAEMINSSQRVLQSGQILDPIEKLRHQCLVRGADGILGLGRAFRRMDDDGSNALNGEEFIKGLRDSGLPVTDEEGQEIFNLWVGVISGGLVYFEKCNFRLDKDGSGSIDMTEFIVAIRVSLFQ